jgi:hypothetical protein
VKKDVKIRLLSWIHEDAQGLVLGVGVAMELFMEGEVGRFFGNCFLGSWGYHGD